MSEIDRVHHRSASQLERDYRMEQGRLGNVVKDHVPKKFVKQAGCPLCADEQMEEEVKYLYDLGMSSKSCGRAVGLGDKGWRWVNAHARAFGWNNERADNTEQIARRGLDMALEKRLFDQLTPEQAIKLLQHVDRRMGKVKDRGDSHLPPQVIIVGVPNVSGVLGKPIEDVVVSGRAIEAPETVPSLAPSFDEEEDADGEK